MKQPRWPEGKRFAFTVFDDTDNAAPGNFEEVYALLRDLGMRTTKSVWPVRGQQTPTIGGATCEDEAYLETILRLQDEGFEIGYHNSSYHGLSSIEIRAALDRFKSHFGHDPVSMSNHADSAEAIYWGEKRLSGLNRIAYNAMTLRRQKGRFVGDDEGSPHFWGDLCQTRIRYVRNFITPEINTLKACPFMPYHDPQRPFVNAWFASTEGPAAPSFIASLTDARQEQLEEEGGACIMYTHFASGFQEHGTLNPEFRKRMERLAARGGWFVPVSTLLDHLAAERGVHSLTGRERRTLERRWLRHKAKIRGTS